MDISELKRLAYDYCNEKRTSYIGGTSMVFHELNKSKFEGLSGFISWIEYTNATGVGLTGNDRANTKPLRKLAPKAPTKNGDEK